MDMLRNLLGKIAQGWKSMSNGKKIGIIVLVSGILTALILFIAFMGKPKYEPLYLNMSTDDMAKVVDKLKQDKVSYKLSGESVLVPKDKVEELRLGIASAGIMPSDGKGFELFDQSSFGRTDTETRILYQRALETELQRTIKAFDAIEYAKVHLVLPEPSVFVKDNEPAKASVTLKMKGSNKLSSEQVKSIIALICGSVENLPKENVEVVDTNFNYLSENTADTDMGSISSVTDRQQIANQFDDKISGDIKKMLEAVFGASKVKVTVNADLDFDSKQISSIKYDTQGIIKSQNKIKETNGGSSTTTSGSPIDNQSSNTIPTGGSSGGSTREEETTEYNVGQVEEKTVKAPGQVRKMSTSVVIDGTLSDAAKASVINIVKAATGFVDDASRQDIITVEGMPFDNTAKKQVEADIAEMQKQQKSEALKQKIVTYGVYPVLGIIGLIALIMIISRVRSLTHKEIKPQSLDVVINEPVPVDQVIKQQAAVALELEDTEPDLTEELKKYADKKPDQIAEIVKSWLAEDSR
jgi:flagellar basal-body M-ring protein/flagellar hook-basal body protein (fliF)